jgi:iron complex transport system permease protein
VGSTSISLARVFDTSIPWADNVDAQIFFVARLPRVLAGALVGSTLAAAGVVLQALLRNPLATPFTLGVGRRRARRDARHHLPAGRWALLGVSSMPVASFLGSMVAIAIVYGLASSQKRGLSTNVLLLAGVTLNSFFSALILFVQYLADFTDAFRTIRWLMGDLDVSSYDPILAALPFILLAFAHLRGAAARVEPAHAGQDMAASRGVDTAHAQRLAFFSASLATGAAVSLGGPIGFIGIVVPHLVRLIVGSDHRIVLPAATLFGAGFLVLCDVISRIALAPLELPVGIITALIGGPFFLWLLVRRS